MFRKIKNFIYKKIFNFIADLEEFEEKKKWWQFTSNPNINIHESFKKKETNIFKGKGVLYGDISIGEGFSLRDYCNILVYPKAKLTIGKRVFFNNFCSVNCLESIEIGDDTLFGEGVKLYDHNHLIIKNTNISVSKDQFSTAPIIIGKNCWLGSNVIVLKGVTIGDNCIVGANCIIHKSIPDNTIVKNNQNHIIETLV